MTGKGSQRKGKRGEEELTAILQQYGYQARRSRSPWLVTMRLEEWLTLYRKGVGNL